MATTGLEPARLDHDAAAAAAAAGAGGPTALSFPRTTFAKLSPRPFLLAHLQPSPSTPVIRPNGRRLDEFRTPTVHTGSLSHAEGSAVVRFGDTAVVCGVKAEILLASDVPASADRVGAGAGSGAGAQAQRHASPQDVIRERGLLVPNVELSTGCSPAHLPGQPPSPLAQSLAVRILSLLHCSELVQEDLRIWHQPPQAPLASPLPSLSTSNTSDNTPTSSSQQEQQQPELKAFWTLYIDMLFISLDGNAFDAAWLSVLGALSDVRLPHAFWDDDRSTILCDADASKARKLRLRAPAPVASTFAVFGTLQPGTPIPRDTPIHRDTPISQGRSPAGKDPNKQNYWILADPDSFEEELCSEVVTLTVTGHVTGVGAGDSAPEKTRLVKLEKAGGGIVQKEQLRDLVRLAGERWRVWRRVLEAELNK